jgi:hypothetical protein
MVRNSPTKPDSAGSPAEPIVTIRNSPAKIGICFQIPPYSASRRVWRRSYSTPIPRNSPPVVRPCDSIA